ncbi:DUF2339 domain-containing protein [Bryocella elongata]|uniref:DUF2339 domain-containing protein n=1 Tax=Bryocella elongata TaxID=863522 RepID=UPI000CDED57D|nr:DUF2339 domain-containing protein [Bryocella elongata]
MEELFLFLLIVAVVWLAVRVSNLGNAATKLEELDRELHRLRERLVALERRPVDAADSVPRPGEWLAQRPQQPKAEATLDATHHPAPATAPFTQHIAPVPVETAINTPKVAGPAVSPTNAPTAKLVQSLAPPAPSLPSFSISGVEPGTARRAISLEERLGHNWLNKLGIVILVTGLALLLGYQVRALGPMGKSLMGFSLSIGILVAGLVLERRCGIKSSHER